MKKSLFAAILLFAAGLALSAADSYQNVKAAAREAEKNKDWAKAAAIYEEALPGLTTTLQQLDALMSMADALVKAKKFDEAVEKLGKIAEDKNKPEAIRDIALLKAAGIHLGRKDSQAAMKIYERLLAESSNPQMKCSVLFAIADTRIKEGKNDEAAAALEKVLGMEGVSEMAKDIFTLRAADLFVKAGKADRAESLCRQTLAAAEKAAAEKAEKKAEKAAKAAEKGKTVKASSDGISGKIIGIRLKLAKVLLAQDKMKESMEIIESTLQLPGITERQRSSIISSRITMLTQAGKYTEAANLIRENLASVKDPDEMVRLYNKLAENCAAMNDKQGALQALDQAAAVIGAKKVKPNSHLRKKLEKPQKSSDAKDAPADK